MATNKPIIVLGMHRTGTSLVANTLISAGLHAGLEEELLAAGSDNPDGFAERIDFVELNEKLLNDLGGSWYVPPGTEALAAADYTLSSTAEVVDHLKAAVPPVTLIKDPRLSLTWRAWTDHFAGAPIVYVYRNPIAVARSLERRNAFPIEAGLALWEIYNALTLEILRQGRNPYLALSYDSIAAGEPYTEKLKKFVSQHTQGLWIREPPKLFREDYNHTPIHAEASGSLTPSQRNLAERCKNLIETQELVESTPTDLATAYKAIATHSSTMELQEARRELLYQKALVTERTGQRDTLHSELQKANLDQKALAAAHEEEKKLHRSLTHLHEKREQDYKTLADAHDKERDAHERTRQVFTNLRSEHDQLIADLNTLHEAHNALHAKHATLDAEHAALNAEHDSVLRNLLRYENSFLGKTQRNISRLFKLVRGKHGSKTEYDQAVSLAIHKVHTGELEAPSMPVSRLRVIGQIATYIKNNPASSFRSITPQRIKRFWHLFSSKSGDDLDVWADSRFPLTRADAAPAIGLPDEDPAEIRLAFESAVRPAVSIIVPAYNEYETTLRCLWTIREYTGDVEYEVIIADDCSTDETATIEQRISGIRVARTESNAHFLRNCNNAARGARGEFVLFLNNDTAVTPGWLSSLLKPFEDDPKVGIVGPKLLFPDGKLQEAGGIVWNDASAWNFGRADDPSRPAYNYRRETDYISGACLLIPRSLWDEIGGFDEQFVPAYYEDTDLCFAVRKRGLKVVYQPDSTVYHYEGVSHGTDLSAGVKKHQVSNQQTFLKKWNKELTTFAYPNAQRVPRARDRSQNARRILLIDHYVPHYDKDAGSRSTWMYIRQMVDMGYRVQVLGANFFKHEPYTSELQQMGVEVLVGEWMARNLDKWLADNLPETDCVLLHRPHIADQFLQHLMKFKQRPPIVYVGHDLHYLRMERELALTGSAEAAKEAARWKKLETNVLQAAERSWYFSDHEVEVLNASMPEVKARSIPLFLFDDEVLPVYAPTRQNSVLFVAGFGHPPNVDAATWLCKEVMPAVRHQCPTVHLDLVGSNPTSEVQALASNAVKVHGYVSDKQLHDIYREATIAVVPLRFGAGVKGKVIEAVRHNVPIVTTSIGAEGIPDASDVMWIADDAASMSALMAELLASPQKRLQKLAYYSEWLNHHFSVERAQRAIIEDIGEPLLAPNAAEPTDSAA